MHKKPEDRRAFDRARKAAARKGPKGDWMRMLESQAKRLRNAMASADEILRQLRRPELVRDDFERRSYLESKVGGGGRLPAVEAAELLGRATTIATDYQRYRGTRPDLDPLDEVPLSALTRRQPWRTSDRGEWEHVIDPEVGAGEDDLNASERVRAVYLAIYRLNGGPKQNLEGGPTPDELADIAQVDVDELADSLTALAKTGRLYVTSEGRMAILRGGQLPGPMPRHVFREASLVNLEAALRGGRTPIDESFEIEDAIKGDTSDNDGVGVLGA